MTDKSIIEQIKHYQRDILKCPDNSNRMIRCIERLNVLPIKIAHLQETGVGRSVNELRKCKGEVGAAANALVCKWKDMVRQDEEDEDSTSEPDEDINPLQDLKSNSSKNNLKDKYTSKNEENKKSTEVNSLRKTDKNNVEPLKSRDQTNSTTSEERKKDYKPSHDSRSSSKTSNYDKSNNEKFHSKSQTNHNADSARNGLKKEKYEMNEKHKHSDSKNTLPDKITSHHKYKDVKEKYEKGKSTSQKSPSKSNSISKQELKHEGTDSSDDEAIYKPSNRKRKKSYSSNEDEYEKRNKHKIVKKSHNSNTNSEESGVENSSDDQDSDRARKINSKSGNYSDGENGTSPERSYSENVSNKGSDTENENSDRKLEDIENDLSKSESESSQEEESDQSSEKYVPAKVKREKVSPPQQSSSNKCDKTKHDSSMKTQSSSHKKSSHSSSTMKNYKSTEVKIKKEKNEKDSTDYKQNKYDSDKKNQQSSANPHKSSSQNKQTDKKVKIKLEKKEDGSIDCESGASFGDALLGLSDSNKKYAKKKPTLEKEKPRSSTSKASNSERPKTKSDRQDPSSFSSVKSAKIEPDLLKNTIKLEPLDVDLKSTLPEISPNYKPMPHYSPPSSPASKRTKLLSHEEALSTIMSTKNQRTKVFSGTKIGYVKVPSLFELCTHVLRENIDALEYTGGVPYDLLKPVLDRATADQLYQLEHYNPYLVEDTDGLWQFHCNKDFRNKKPDEFETWRELYLRCLDEREKKLEALKTNITQSMAKSIPVRKTKLAYVDSVVKPPRNVAKQQMKFGTGKQELVSKAMMGAASSSPAPPPVSVPAPPHPRPNLSNSSFPIPNFLKKKKAPLMAKTLQLMKGSNRFKR